MKADHLCLPASPAGTFSSYKFFLFIKTCSVLLIPGRGVGCDFEATRVTDEFIQDADDLFELGPVVPLFLPAVQHQLVEGGRAVHGRGQAVTLIHSLYYLDVGGKVKT